MEDISYTIYMHKNINHMIKILMMFTCKLLLIVQNVVLPFMILVWTFNKANTKYSILLMTFPTLVLLLLLSKIWRTILNVIRIRAVQTSQLMMPKCSPVRCTTPTLEQPLPEKIEQYKKTFKGGSGAEPAKYPPKVKSENVFYNSRVLERS